jgi:hypothetical protein
MSAFDRLPAEYRELCAAIAKNSPPRILAHRKVRLSPQNRRVRFAADQYLAERRHSEREAQRRMSTGRLPRVRTP